MSAWGRRLMKKVLIIEDDPDMQAIYRCMFEEEKSRYEATIVPDPLAALALLRKKRFDTIISDIIMEEMSGDSFLERAREERRHRDVPIIVVSVLGEAMLAKLKSMPRIRFMQKPITREELFRALSHLGRR